MSGSAHERFFGEVLRFGVNLESRVVALTHDLEYATQIGRGQVGLERQDALV